jgi:hypothetical protein
MKRAAVALGVAAVAIWATAVLAQGRNFAGSWTIDAEKTSAVNAASGGAEVMVRGGSGGAVVAAGGGGGRGGGGTATGAAAGTEVRRLDPAGATGGVIAAAGGGARGGGGGGRGGAGPMTITMDAGTLTITNGPTSTAYRLDGTPTTTETPRGTSTSKSTWKSDRLVIETTVDTPNGPQVTTVAWYMDGEWLVRETSSTAADGSVNVRKTYYKKA